MCTKQSEHVILRYPELQSTSLYVKNPNIGEAQVADICK